MSVQACIYKCALVFMHMYVCMCVFVCWYMCVYTYIHTQLSLHVFIKYFSDSESATDSCVLRINDHDESNVESTAEDILKPKVN